MSSEPSLRAFLVGIDAHSSAGALDEGTHSAMSICTASHSSTSRRALWCSCVSPVLWLYSYTSAQLHSYKSLPTSHNLPSRSVVLLCELSITDTQLIIPKQCTRWILAKCTLVPTHRDADIHIRVHALPYIHTHECSTHTHTRACKRTCTRIHVTHARTRTQAHIYTPNKTTHTQYTIHYIHRKTKTNSPTHQYLHTCTQTTTTTLACAPTHAHKP